MPNPPDTFPPTQPNPASADPAFGGGRSLFVQRNSPVNVALIAGSILLTLWTSFGGDVSRLLPWLVSLQPPDSTGWLLEVRHGQLWRLVTPIFLHFSWPHLGFNMLAMYSLGTLLERRIGSRDYLALTMGVAVLSTGMQYFIGGSPQFGGMSGVVYGLFGYVWLRAYTDATFGLMIPRESVVLALIWFVLCFTGTVGDIANTAHTAGLVLGALWGVVDGRAAMRKVRRARGWPGQVQAG